VPLARVVHRRTAVATVGAFDARFGVHEEWEWLLRAATTVSCVQVPVATALAAGRGPAEPGPSGRARLYECWPVTRDDLRAARAERLALERTEIAA
jgi:hypothetical protein